MFVNKPMCVGKRYFKKFDGINFFFYLCTQKTLIT